MTHLGTTISPPTLAYRSGLAVVRGAAAADVPSWMHADARLGAHVAPGCRLAELRAWGAEHGWRDLDRVGGPRSVAESTPGEVEAAPLFDPRTPRPDQQAALARWTAAGGRGTVVLPTGAGKSLVAVHALHRAGVRGCVVAPTRALVAQWFAQLADAFGAARVGAFYADEKDVRDVTVTTYHSLFALQERWGARFDLLVLDEAHHLADAATRAVPGPVSPFGRGDDDALPPLSARHDALRIAPAAHRLGLTATYPDGRDAALRALVGPVVYRRSVAELADRELARFVVERRFVALTPGERARYDALTRTYDDFMLGRDYAERVRRARAAGDVAYATATREPDDTGDAWRMFMNETRRSPAARRAFGAYRERERLVALAAHKLRETVRLLGLFPAERALLFCGSAEAAERVSRALAVPMITAATPAPERRAVLAALAEGRVRAVASVRVLDEGWDVPSAKLGVVLGDSTRGSPQQHAQRLGRILRRQGDAVASLYELVAAGTHEFFASQRRGAGTRAAAAERAAGQLGLGF